MSTDPVGADWKEPASSHDTADWMEQVGFRVRFGWGPNGLRRLAPNADAVVIIDVLSFSTCVDVALGRGAVVLPYRWNDDKRDEYAAEHNAVAAKHPRDAGPDDWTLSPSRLMEIPAGTRLVLPSPNGSSLAFGAEEAGADRVHVACLRNRAAVGRRIADAGTIAVIAAGERWRGATGPLRPAVEDLIGAGAIVDAVGLDGASPEAMAAAAVFRDAQPDLDTRLHECGSGRELIDKGFGPNVAIAAALDVSEVVPTLAGVELIDG